MRIGLGLPNAVPGTTGEQLLDWAREGERAGFTTLATTDRLVYDSHESLSVLAAAAAVTERARLLSAILIAPLRGAALLAKQAATVDRISGGRLDLGLAVGVRPDDFRAAGVEPAGRGAALDRQVAEMRAVWSGERRGFAGGIGPSPVAPDGPDLLFGGHSPGAVARVAAWGSGWIGGSGGVSMFAAGAAAVRESWRAARRAGTPWLTALQYVALGPDATADADRYLGDYYGFAPPYAAQVRSQAAVGEEELQAAVTAFDDAGCDELLLVPCSADPKQVDLAAAALGH